MCALTVSSQTVVTYKGYLLEAGTISAKSLQPYLSALNAVQNDFEYPPPACGHLVKLARKGFADLQGSVILTTAGHGVSCRAHICDHSLRALVPTPLSPTFVCVLAWLLNSPS